MTAVAPPVMDRLFEPRHLMLASGDVDEIVGVCTKALRPHALLARRRDATLATRLHHLPIGPFSLNRLRYGGDVTVAPAVPEEDNFLVTLPLDGKARFSYGAEASDLEPGRGAIVGPYEAFRFDIDAAFDQIIVRLDRRRVESVGASLVGSHEALPVHFALSLRDVPPFWHKLLDAAVSLASVGDGLAHPRLFGHLEELLIEALLLSQPNSLSAAMSAASRPAPSAQIRRAMAYMRAHIAAPVRMGAVARHCGVSLRGLQAGFQRDLGMSPSQWLRAERLERVYADLLSAAPGSVTVTGTALRWGFFHLGEFAAQFRARFGERPSEVLAKRDR